MVRRACKDHRFSTTIPHEHMETPLQGQLLGLGLAPRTAQIYANVIASASRWWDNEDCGNLASASAADVARYAQNLPNTFAARSQLRCALKRYWELVGHDSPPLQAVRVPPAPRGRCLALDEGDSRILAKAARARGDHKGLAVALGLYQALRRNEIATLPWSAVDGDWLTVQGKFDLVASIPMHPTMGEMLSAHHRNGSPYIFPGRVGGHVSPATVWGWVRQVSEEAGLGRVKTHVLRHISLATSYDTTGDLRGVMEFARHSRPETTSRYTRSTERRLRAIVEALDY